MQSPWQPCRGALHSAAVLAVFAFEALVYNLVYLGIILPACGKEHFILPFAATFDSFLGMAFLCYLRARFSDPGVVPHSWQRFVSHVGQDLAIAPPRLEWQPGKATYCSHCGVPRPERAHHCRLCGVCVLRMDHHCPWLSNCVGFHNHKFFILSLFYAVISCLVGLAITGPQLVYFGRILASRILDQDHEVGEFPDEIPIATSQIITFIIWGLIALALLLLLSIMLAAHLELLVNNATTIEGHYSNMPNPFDRGSSFGNIQEIFGTCGPDWLLPVAPCRPRGDGVSFDRPENPLPQEVLLAGQGELTQEQIWRLRYRVRRGGKLGEAENSMFRTWWNRSSPCADNEPLMYSSRSSSSTLRGGATRHVIHL